MRAPLENRSTVQPEGLLNLEKQSIPRAGVPMPPRECYIPGAAVASSMTRERDVPQAVSALEPTRQVDSQPPLPRETGPARNSEREAGGIYTLGLARLAIAVTWACLTRINGITCLHRRHPPLAKAARRRAAPFPFAVVVAAPSQRCYCTPRRVRLSAAAAHGRASACTLGRHS